MERQSVMLQVTGMHCAACATRIERVVQKDVGVLDVNVNLALERATVVYRTDITQVPDIIARVQKLGYGATILESGQRSLNKADDARRQIEMFLFALILSAPFVWTMLHMAGLPYIPQALLNPWVQLALASQIQFIAGWTFYRGAFLALRNMDANMDVLVCLGTSAAYAYSLWMVLSGGHNEYFETSALIITLVRLGKLMEARTKIRTADTLQRMMALQARMAHQWTPNGEQDIPADQLQRGDFIIVKPGERIPADGFIVDGESNVDESLLTGEFLPIAKEAGDLVYAASINQYGALRVRVEKIAGDSTFGQIIRLMEEAQGAKAPIQRMTDTICRLFVPSVVFIALFTFCFWLFFTSSADHHLFSTAMTNATAVLLIACPCPLGLATPTAIVVGTGRGAEMGVFFKSGEHLESLHQASVVLLDKTGTITIGQPVVTDVLLLKHKYVRTKSDLLRFAGSAELPSEHPLANMLVTFARTHASLCEPAHFSAFGGRGIRAVIEGHVVLVGNAELMREHNIQQQMPWQKQDWETTGKTVIIIAVDGVIAGLIAISDTVHPSSAQAIAKLKRMGLEVMMVTGDNAQTARAMAADVGIQHFYAELSPEDKVCIVRHLQRQGRKVAMVGDGINDAPALASADIGIALGTGADVSVAAADITLISGDLQGVVHAIELSKATMRNIRRSLGWALGYNAIGIPIAACGGLNPLVAGAAMAFSSIAVILNALQLKRVHFSDFNAVNKPIPMHPHP
ncbi:heavy metal translocating P-type ATPase [Alicyclobacillus fodiniaquatilis]|uniref:P-type Cu(+) transporter n=1 Tax=Alicyclobacillus fodiniaquatilis TaxID=1661150 RepID=A0ABW4JPZ6_9BACL